MEQDSYGVTKQSEIVSDIEFYVEELTIRGYTVIPSVLSQDELEEWRDKIDRLYSIQESEFGKDRLQKIYELDVCRAPLLYDQSFLDMATMPIILDVVEKMLGSWYILNLQNAIINKPGIRHHQMSWHRDLPYQNFVISTPLSVNALFAVDDFSEQTGGTCVVPYTHKTEMLPSARYVEQNMINTEVAAGSVIMFDSMLFHRAGCNTSNIIRRSVNHMYTSPIIKQQYDFSASLKGIIPESETFLRQFLGYTSPVPVDDKQWRELRWRKSQSSDQDT